MKILVAENHHKIAEIIKTELEQENYIVDVCFDGTSGLEHGLTGNYDLIILDHVLSGVNGLDISVKLRQNSIHTPVLLLTAKGQIDDQIDGNVDDYMVKPFALGELLAKVRILSLSQKPTIEKILTFKDLTLNVLSFKVTRGVESLKLSRREYLILKYFMLHPNQIISKNQLIAGAWNYNSIVGPNNVEVYINRLRHKIDKPYKNSYIVTEKGFGYKLSGN